MRSMALRLRKRNGEKQFFHFGLRRNVGQSAAFLDFLAKSVGVVAFIGMDHVAIRQLVEKRRAGRTVSAADRVRARTRQFRHFAFGP